MTVIVRVISPLIEAKATLLLVEVFEKADIVGFLACARAICRCNRRYNRFLEVTIIPSFEPLGALNLTLPATPGPRRHHFFASRFSSYERLQCCQSQSRHTHGHFTQPAVSRISLSYFSGGAEIHKWVLVSS